MLDKVEVKEKNSERVVRVQPIKTNYVSNDSYKSSKDAVMKPNIKRSEATQNSDIS